MTTVILPEGFPDGSVGKESTCNAGDLGDMDLIPGSRRSPGGGHGNPFQYPCLENPMDRGAWRATVQGVTKESNTTERLNNNPEERNHSGTRGMAMQKNSEPRILQPGNSRFEKLWILDSENPRNSRGRDS